MAEDIGGVLKEVSGYLRRIAEQNEKRAKAIEDSRLRAEEKFGKSREQLAEAKATMDRNRENRLTFKNPEKK